jgi:antitoxin HigA-1
MAITASPHFAVHAGTWLHEEIVKPRNLSVTGLARHFGVSRQAMSTLLNGRVGLKAFGLKADTLCRMQTNYDLALARTTQALIKVERFVDAA